MPVPVSLRPDRRGQTFVRGRGWVPIEDTREYKRKKQREQYEAERAEAMRQKHIERRISQGMALLFGGDY